MEKIIAYYCGPALAGIKPANIVACHKDKISDIHKKIDELNYQMNKRDIYFEIVCECEKRVLLMVYRKKILQAALSNYDVQEFLKSYAYPENADVNVYMDILKQRLAEDEFPHEIGIFLGYPLHDIYGFINHKNEGCVLTGEWKVYENPEQAQRMFERFSKCRAAIARRMEQGLSLEQVFYAA